MRNQYMAKVLVHNKMVTEDQVNAHWGEISDSMDIGQVLVRAGVLQQGVYEKVLAFVMQLEAKNGAAAPQAAPAPQAASAPASQPQPAAQPAQPAQTPRATASIPVVQSNAAIFDEPEEPALQLEGNNMFGGASSSNLDVEKIAGLESTSMASFSIFGNADADEAEDSENGELPTRFILTSGEGDAVQPPETLLPIMNLKKMIAFARNYGATDIYLFAGRQVMMRQSGGIFPATEKPIDKTRIADLLTEASEGFADGYKIVAGRNFSKTFALAGVGRCRITVTWNDVVPSVAIRLIQMESVPLENLGLPPFCGSFAALNSGLVLIAGPSASGRSTTMTAFAETVAVNRSCYIQTIEKPIERLLANPNGALVQKEVGLHVRTGLAGVELAIRDGADVICFDQLETMDELKLLLQAANAGALVFAVTTGNSIQGLLSRLLATIPDGDRSQFANALADQLKGIIVQHLIPMVNNQGLVLATEALRLSSTTANMIRKGDLTQLVPAISSQKDQGIILEDSLQKCVEAGYIDGVEAWKRASDSRRFANFKPASQGA